MDQFFQDMRVCRQIAGDTWRRMSFPSSYTKLPCTGHCFLILLPPNGLVKAVSCSIPPDPNRGIAKQTGSLEITYETALVGHDDNFIHNHALGYNDIHRFNNITEVEEEVMRVANLLT